LCSGLLDADGRPVDGRRHVRGDEAFLAIVWETTAERDLAASMSAVGE